MKVVTTALMISTVVGVGMACGRSAPALGGLSPERPDSVTIDVINDNFYDADIFAEYEGDQRRRLGMVSGFSSQSFTIPYRDARLVMVMRLIGVGEALSNVLSVSPGDVLELRLEPDLHHKLGRR
jgi:hypothetical protein